MGKILLIEDSLFSAMAIKTLLEAKNHVVEHIAEGTNAKEMIILFKPDLIILDLMMPGVSGQTLFKELKNNEQTKNIPILIATARVDAVNLKEFLCENCEIMTKPFDNNELLETINTLIKK